MKTDKENGEGGTDKPPLALSQPSAFERWILGCDKYIHLKYYKKSKLFGFMIGIILFVSSIFIFNAIDANKTVVSYFNFSLIFFSVLFYEINSVYWIDKFRLEQKLKNIKSEHPYFFSIDIPKFGNHRWIKTRIQVHYFCTGYNFFMKLLEGWCLSLILVKSLGYFFK